MGLHSQTAGDPAPAHGPRLGPLPVLHDEVDLIVGLALGVSLVMLPVGIVVGLFGCALFVGGLLAKIPGDGR